MELKDLLEYTGIEAENMEDFKTKFNEKFVADEKQAIQKYLKPVIGQKFNKIKQNLLNKARTEGLEFTNSEFDNIELEEVHELLSEKRTAQLKADLEDIKKKAGANGDDVVKEWEAKYAQANQRAADAEKLKTSLATEFETFKSQSANQVKSVKLDYFRTNLMSKLPFKAGITELEKTGFDSYVSSNYKLDFDDTGKEFVTDAQGERIRSSKKADEFKTPDEVFVEVADKFGILAKNPQAGKPVGQPFNPNQAPTTPSNGGTPQPAKRKVNPMFDNY